MHRIKRFRPSPAMIVACIALVLSLGGTSYAAVVLPAGSVGTKQLKKNAVVSSKVKNGSLTLKDIRTSSLSSLGRVAMASNHVTSTTAATRVAVVSLTAPANGFVLVQGWVDADELNGHFYVRVWDDSTSEHSPYFNGAESAGLDTAVGNTAVFQVTPGERKFSVRVEQSADTAFEAYGTITAQFIPYGATGSATSLTK